MSTKPKKRNPKIAKNPTVDDVHLEIKLLVVLRPEHAVVVRSLLALA